MIGGPADYVWSFDVQPGRVLEEGLFIEPGDLFRGLAFSSRALFEFVLAGIFIAGEMPDVGDVHHVLDLVVEILHDPAEHVGEDIGAEIADVGVHVHGRAAGVDADLARYERHELVFPPCKGVV